MSFRKLEPLFISKKRRFKLLLLMKNAGVRMNIRDLFSKAFIAALVLNVCIVVYLAFRVGRLQFKTLNYVMVLSSSAIIMFFAVFFAMIILVHFLLNLRIYQRRVMIEDVFADYLQIAAANVRAGMTIDRALWSSIKKRFGVLANEMEEVAKKAMSGEEIGDALIAFSKKYDSPLLDRSVNLIIEGIDAGGEIADLLSKVAWNITETQAMKKEMAASVVNYCIFISFATILAAPLLFALSTQLLGITKIVTGALDLGTLPTAAAGINIPMGMGGDSGGLTQETFQTFALVSLAITSLFSAMIVSIIQKGTIKAGIKYIPAFILATTSLYLIFNFVFSKMFGSFF